MSIRVHRDLRHLVRHALGLGWSLSVAGSGHLRLRSPEGRAVYLPASPGNAWRTRRELRARLRREGVAA